MHYFAYTLSSIAPFHVPHIGFTVGFQEKVFEIWRVLLKTDTSWIKCLVVSLPLHGAAALGRECCFKWAVTKWPEAGSGTLCMCTMYTSSRTCVAYSLQEKERLLTRVILPGCRHNPAQWRRCHRPCVSLTFGFYATHGGHCGWIIKINKMAQATHKTFALLNRWHLMMLRGHYSFPV